jgi:hypothetical protein
MGRSLSVPDRYWSRADRVDGGLGRGIMHADAGAGKMCLKDVRSCARSAMRATFSLGNIKHAVSLPVSCPEKLYGRSAPKEGVGKAPEMLFCSFLTSGSDGHRFESCDGPFPGEVRGAPGNEARVFCEVLRASTKPLGGGCRAPRSYMEGARRRRA